MTSHPNRQSQGKPYQERLSGSRLHVASVVPIGTIVPLAQLCNCRKNYHLD